MSFNPDISVMYILSSINGNNQCDGGNPFDTLTYIKDNGIATNNCVSYTEACNNCKFCNGHQNDDNSINEMIPEKGCCNNKSKHFLYYVQNIRTETNIDKIKKHILKYGCAIGGFTVYQSFQDDSIQNFRNTNGIYMNTNKTEEPIGFHAICILGWGIDKINNKNIPYWICRNSWGNDWGDNGYFKFALYQIGINENCALEKIYTTSDNLEIGGIILFEPNGFKLFENVPLSSCDFLKTLNKTDREKLEEYYGKDEDENKENIKPILSSPNPTDNNDNKTLLKWVLIIIGIIIVLSILMKLLS